MTSRCAVDGCDAAQADGSVVCSDHEPRRCPRCGGWVYRATEDECGSWSEVAKPRCAACEASKRDALAEDRGRL